MSMITCRECGEEASTEAKVCPHCGVKNPSKSTYYIKRVATIIVVIFIGSLILDSDMARDFVESQSEAKCAVTKISLESGPLFIDGEPNFAFVVSVTVENTGERGFVDVLTKLSTSEGNLKREQEIILDAGESRQLSYQFHEPTVNATNIEYAARCTPG